MSILCRVILSHFQEKSKTTLYTGLLLRNLQTKPDSKVTTYLLNKYVSFVKSYEKVLSRKFPAAMKFYQVFSVGLKYFKKDVMILFKAFKKLNAEGWECLTRKELEIYHLMPKDILRTAPVLVVGAAVPFGGLIFIVAYYFPKQMLTYHFWSLQQRSEFSLLDHKKKLQFYRPVFRCMQSHLSLIKEDSLYNPMKEILDSLGSGIHPNVDLILSCKPLFQQHPYGLSHLTRSHVVSLLKLYDMHRGWQRRKRLMYKANVLQLMDKAILKEGGLQALNQDELKLSCFLRGLNPINMKHEDILNWMNAWLTISQQIDKNSYSLLLHSPILLGYNQPSNWWLLHGK